MAKRTKKSSADDEPKKAPNLQLGMGCPILFTLPFAGVGVFMTGWVVRDLWTYDSVQSWEATPAKLLQAELESRHDDNGTTYQATARYRYEYGGKSYENDRVALHASADNIGGYQRQRGKELERLHRKGQSVTAFVNPADPTQAMLFRDLRPGMLALKGLFGLLFGGVGFGLLGAGFFGLALARRELKLKESYPDEPWRWQENWRHGRLRSSGDHAWGALLFAILWNLISWPTFALAATSDEVNWPILLAVALFPAIGTAMAGWTAYLWLQRWKWGVSEFEMAAVPGVLGGPLAGMIRAPARIEPEDGIAVRLACVRSVAEEKRKRDVTLWEEERTIVRNLSTASGERTLIPVQFVIPYDLPDSGADDVTWKLTAAAKTAGVDYKSEFDVPVFKTAASLQSPPAMALDGQLFASIALATIASGSGGLLEEDFPDRKVLDFPMARHLGMSAFLVLFTAGWIAVSVGLFYIGAPWILSWVISAFGAILLPIAVWTALERTRLEFGVRGVKYTRRIAGIGKEHAFEPAEITSVVALKSGTSYGNIVFWNIELRDRQGARHALATAIPRRQLAERLAEEIAVAVGLSQSRTGSEASRMELESELPAELRRG